jgi:glycosyltransferase involved in cell wall biosynthesis
MKVLQAITAFHPAVIYGGPSVIAMQQSSALTRRGHKVSVATSNVLELRPLQIIERHTLDLDGVKVRYFPSRVPWPHFPFIFSREFERWLLMHIESFDVVHIHFAREWIPIRTAQVAISKGIPVFLQPHGMLGRVDGVRSLIDKIWVKRILEDVTGVFSLNQEDSDEIERIAPHARIFELPNGISLPTIAKRWTENNLADPIVLFLARLHPRKRVSSFIEMARLLSAQGVAARYRIVGPDGGDLAKAQRLVHGYKLENQITFVGSVQGEAVSREYLNSAVYVLPSVNEPFPMTVLEALSFGVPTVVTDTCSIAPMLEEEGAALVSAPEAPMLARLVGQILVQRQLAQRLSSGGKRLVEEKLTVERVAERMESYYTDAYARDH